MQSIQVQHFLLLGAVLQLLHFVVVDDFFVAGGKQKIHAELPFVFHVLQQHLFRWHAFV